MSCLWMIKIVVLKMFKTHSVHSCVLIVDMMSHSQYTEEKIDTMEHTSQLIRDLDSKMKNEIFIGIQVLSTWES